MHPDGAPSIQRRLNGVRGHLDGLAGPAGIPHSFSNGAYTSQTCTIATVTTRPLRSYGGPEGFREISRSGRQGYGIGDMELDSPLNSSAKAARPSLMRLYG
jgi:hypothetical protein